MIPRSIAIHLKRWTEIADLRAAREELQIEQPDLAGARRSLEKVRSLRTNGESGFAAAVTGLTSPGSRWPKANLRKLMFWRAGWKSNFAARSDFRH